jgi:RNA polymerase sigma-70 factor (ECF subfamily)
MGSVARRPAIEYSPHWRVLLLRKSDGGSTLSQTELEASLNAERAELTEATLMSRARDGDAHAFGELVRRHMRRAYFASLGLVGSHDDALDLSQEAFTRALNASSKLDPERPFYPWLYGILRRLCLNHLRDGRSRQAKLAEAGAWLQDEARERASGADPSRAAERDELRRRLATAIESLPPIQREVLVLREFEGLRYREIAELLEIPEGTVMSRLYAARNGLAAALGDDL